jgi:hypothetical protein
MHRQRLAEAAPGPATMGAKSKRLTVLTDAEKFAVYSLPDFDEGQRLEYLTLSAQELALASSRPSLGAQVYCALQIGPTLG